MSYFPTDIPFMSEDGLKENGIRIPKDQKSNIDVYIYKLDLNVEKPIVEKFPGQIRDGSYGDEVIRWIGPISHNDYKIWHSEFDIKMLGVVYEPLNNVVELIDRFDGMSTDEATMLIQDYCCKKAASFRKKLDMFNRGIGAATESYIRDGWNV